MFCCTHPEISELQKAKLEEQSWVVKCWEKVSHLWQNIFKKWLTPKSVMSCAVGVFFTELAHFW